MANEATLARPASPVVLPRVGPARAARRVRRTRLADMFWAAVFMGPNAVMFTVFILVPIGGAFALSLFEWNLVDPPVFVGLDHFAEILRDERAQQAILRTGYMVVGGVLPTILLSFLLAVLIDVRFPGFRIVRTLYLMPLVISFVAAALLWRWIFEPRIGPLNTLLGAVGIAGPGWIASPGSALVAVTIVMIWMRMPIAILLYLAAIQNINPSLIEAARIDGAGPIAQLRYVVWPAVRPVTFFVLVITLHGLLFDAFDVVNVMTAGGPLNSTDILIKYIYDAAFRDFQFGYASALATVLFVIVAGIALALLPFSRRSDA